MRSRLQGCAQKHACLLDRLQDQEKNHFEGDSKDVQGSIPPHVENTSGPFEKVFYPSTTAAQPFIMTLFLTAAKGEDQSDLDRNRRRHEKEVTRNESGLCSLSSSESIVSGA